MKVVIVGGVAGGASCAARLRRLSEDTQILLFERGEYISFANCGLPYYIGGTITEKSALTLQTPQSMKARFNLDVRTCSEVIRIDRQDKTVTVRTASGKEYQESYDKLVLSPGAAAVRPPIPGSDLDEVFTLRNIPDTYKIVEFIEHKKPQRALVVGGGYIGLEMAENLVDKGLSVTLAEMAPQVLAPLDFEMASELHRHMLQKGVDLRLSTTVQSIERGLGGLVVELGSEKLPYDFVVMAVGVRPENALAKSAGLTLGATGGIWVNDQMQTSDEDIYAVGDVIEVNDFVSGKSSLIPLAGPANRQGRIVADHICGITQSYTGTQGTAIVKCFDMTAACTGMNERAIKNAGISYDKVYLYPASHATYYPGAVSLGVKVLFEVPTGKVLGGQFVGFDGVDKRCDVLATAIRAGMTVHDLTRLELSYAPPFSSAKDPINLAGFMAENQLTGKVKTFYWDEVSSLATDGSVVLIDVRTPQEFENGSIAGFINIPVDELRTRIGEIDKQKKVYITCQVGLRGYVACRMLMQNGFDCANLSGGVRLYKTVFGNNTKQESAKTPDRSEQVQGKTIEVNACGLQCPGPILKLNQALSQANDGDTLTVSSTDPGFLSDMQGYCRRTGNELLSTDTQKGVFIAVVRKGSVHPCQVATSGGDAKNIIVFSGDLDKAIASFIIANAAAAMGRKVQMFFTFWGLNILRKPKRVRVKKDIISRMFGMMMPRGSKKLGLSKMNMMGMGPAMIRMVMKKKNIASLEELMQSALENGVELVACTMSMDVMGIKAEELIDGVKQGGAAAMLANAEESDMSLFI